MIVSDNKWKDFRYSDEVPAKVLREQFDYQDANESTDGFICYKGFWYHVDQFMQGGVEGWDGSHADSWFSGVVIRISDDGEQYMIGTWISD